LFDSILETILALMKAMTTRLVPTAAIDADLVSPSDNAPVGLACIF